MNLIELARFSLMTDSLVASPAKYVDILNSFLTSDSDLQGYKEALHVAFSGVPMIVFTNLSEAARLASLDSIENALQTASGGYDKGVGEMLSWAVARRRLSTKKQKKHLHLAYQVAHRFINF